MSAVRYPLLVFGVKDISARFVEFLCENGHPPDSVVTIDERIPAETVVSGYGSMDALRERYGVTLFKTDSYRLDSRAARAFFAENEFDLGISMNWSKLIPGWILERFQTGVFGLHGSCGYLPFGRGRATLNWSLVCGDERFVMQLFRLDAGADAPDVYDRLIFEINPFDDIRTLQYKDLLASEQLALRLLENRRAGMPVRTRLQQSDPEHRFPGRRPEDGRLDLHARTREICALVRAVTHPFPGAFAFCAGERVLLWRAQPFDRMLDFSGRSPGEVIDVFDERPLVRTVDGSMLILEYESPRPLKPGDRLE